MYKMIVCDLDGTLLTDERHVSQKDAEAIRKAEEKGVIFFPLTGRGYYTALDTIKELGHEGKKGQYFGSYNGSVITDDENNEVVYYDGGLSYDVCKKLFDFTLKYPNVRISFHTLSNQYCHYTLGDNPARSKPHNDILIDEGNFEILKDLDICKALILTNEESQAVQIINEAQKEIPELFFGQSSGRFIEIVKRGTNKGVCLDTISRLTGISLQEMIAIGDNPNDNPMLQKAGLGCCVANGLDGCKAAADYVCQCSNNDGGVAEVINKFILGEDYV